MIDISPNKNVRFTLDDGLYRGFIVGIATIPQAIIGSMIMIKITSGPIPNDEYPYEVMAIPQNFLKEDFE